MAKISFTEKIMKVRNVLKLVTLHINYIILINIMIIFVHKDYARVNKFMF